jgi:hypothetical protein
VSGGRNDTRLEDLFDKLVDRMAAELDKEEVSPGLLKEIRQLLLDNDIKQLPRPTNPMGNLVAKLPFPKN